MNESFVIVELQKERITFLPISLMWSALESRQVRGITQTHFLLIFSLNKKICWPQFSIRRIELHLSYKQSGSFSFLEYIGRYHSKNFRAIGPVDVGIVKYR